MFILTEDVIKIGKSLSDNNRVEIIKILSNNEICACKLLEHLNITQPTLSHHMKQLVQSKLVEVTKKGQWSYYKLNQKTINEFKKFLETSIETKKQL